MKFRFQPERRVSTLHGGKKFVDRGHCYFLHFHVFQSQGHLLLNTWNVMSYSSERIKRATVIAANPCT